MSNSKLVNYTKISPNTYGKRNHAIDRITPHCVVGQCSVEALGAMFAQSSRQASSNYGIGADGRVGMYVEEGKASWCSSSYSNDERAVTIECASDTIDPYKMNKKVYKKLVKLCTDICKRNGKTKLIWFNSSTKALAYAPASNEMVLTVHRWFKQKACPGDWLYNRLGKLAKAVNKNLAGYTTVKYKVKIMKNVNVRQEPKKTSKKIKKISKDAVCTIIEINKNKKWGKVKGYNGWIALAYTKKII